MKGKTTKQKRGLSAGAISHAVAVWFRRDAAGWLMLLPSLLCFTIFIWQSLLSGIRTSFYETRGFDLVEFIGLDNYINIISDSGFVNAVKNTWSYALWSVVLGLFTPVFTSIILNEIFRGTAFFRFRCIFRAWCRR